MWLWWRRSFKSIPANTAKTVWHMAWCHHTEPQPVSWAVVSVWLTCNKTWHLMTSPACATSDNKTTATLSLWVCGLQMTAFLNLDSVQSWCRSLILFWCSSVKCFFICVLQDPSLSFFVLTSAAGGTFASANLQTLPWCLSHVWRPPVISFLCCVKWTMISLTLSLYLSHYILHCLACFSILRLPLSDEGG